MRESTIELLGYDTKSYINHTNNTTIQRESLAGINFGKFSLSEHLAEKSLANE